MNEREIYLKLLNALFTGLKTDKHQKFKNDRTEVRKFAVEDLYPDVILTKKDSDEIDFIIEIVLKEHLNQTSLSKKWLPLSKAGPNFYLLVPKSNLNIVQTWCSELKMKVRFGTYEIIKDDLEIKFF